MPRRPLVSLTGSKDPAATCRDIYNQCQAELEERGRPVAVIAVVIGYLCIKGDEKRAKKGKK